MTTPHSPAPSLDDVWRAFIETDRKFQETERLLKESAQERDQLFKDLVVLHNFIRPLIDG